MSGLGPGSWTEFCKTLWTEILKAMTTPSGGVGIVKELGSGYSVEDERMERTNKLLGLCEEAVANPAWFQRPDGTTYCNRGAAFIAQGMGYFGFPHGSLANQMIAYLEQDPTWRTDSLERAADHANRGGLALMAISEEPHGHLCAVAPLPMAYSGSWGCRVPMVANVGPSKYHGIVRASVAFSAAKKPRVKCFVYMGDVA